MSNTDGQPPLCTGAPQAQQQPPHHDRQARCNDSLCHHSHQVCLLRLSGLRTADVQKSKTDAFFQLQQKQQNHWNKTKVEACNIQPGFSRSDSDCVLAINYNLEHLMLCSNCCRWMENDSKIMCSTVWKSKGQIKDNWILDSAGERVQQQAQSFKEIYSNRKVLSDEVIFPPLFWMACFFFVFEVHIYLLCVKTHTHTRTHTGKCNFVQPCD